MDQLRPGISDLGIPAQIEKPDLRVHLTRVPYDEYFHLDYVKDGRKISEELDTEETKKWFKDHMVKCPTRELELRREEALGKAMDETWNFYEGWVTIPGDVYCDPVKPFPQYQPQV